MADKRTERFLIEVEYEVWEVAGLDRRQIREAAFDGLPVIVPDAKGDEGVELQYASESTLRSKLEAEVERLRERQAKCARMFADDRNRREVRAAERGAELAYEAAADRLQAILSDVETGEAENPVKSS